MLGVVRRAAIRIVNTGNGWFGRAKVNSVVVVTLRELCPPGPDNRWIVRQIIPRPSWPHPFRRALRLEKADGSGRDLKVSDKEVRVIVP